MNISKLVKDRSGGRVSLQISVCENQANTMDLVKREVRGIYRNLLILGFSWTLLLTGYHGVTILQSSINRSLTLLRNDYIIIFTVVHLIRKKISYS